MSIRPNYYGGSDSVYEVFKVIDAWGLDFYRGNALKYIARAGKKVSRTGRRKAEIEDLRKAITYLEQSIEKLNLEIPKSQIEDEYVHEDKNRNNDTVFTLLGLRNDF